MPKERERVRVSECVRVCVRTRARTHVSVFLDGEGNKVFASTVVEL